MDTTNKTEEASSPNTTDDVGTPNKTEEVGSSNRTENASISNRANDRGTSNETSIVGISKQTDDVDVPNKTNDVEIHNITNYVGSPNKTNNEGTQNETNNVGTTNKNHNMDTSKTTYVASSPDKTNDVCTPNNSEKALKQRLRSLFHLLIAKHPDAEIEIKDILQTSPNLLKQKVFFLTNKPFFPVDFSSDTYECKCDWLFETFIWLQTENMPGKSYTAYITNSIENGKCLHYSRHSKIKRTVFRRPPSIQLIHAAAAVGYISVLEALLCLHSDDLPLTQSNKLSPLDIAIFRQEVASVKTIMTFLKSQRIGAKTLRERQPFDLLYEWSDMSFPQSLDWAVTNKTLCSVMEYAGGLGLRGVLSLGCDVDSWDYGGVCLLQRAVKDADPCIILDILYYNPSAVFLQSWNESILTDAIARDQNLTHTSTGPISLLILDCGYNVRGDRIFRSNYYFLLATLKTKGPYLRREIMKRVREDLFCPKSLLMLCKDALRKGFPGLTLHKVVNQTLPSPLKDFVLMETRLKQQIGQCVMDGSYVSNLRQFDPHSGRRVVKLQTNQHLTQFKKR